MEPRISTRAMVATLLAVFVLSQTASRLTEAQRRLPQRRSAPKAAQKRTRDNSVFKHEDHRAGSNGKEILCSSCHTISSADHPDQVNAATKPSIIGFPYHDSCLECHRLTPPQFFRSTAPIVCTVCHTRSSPRLTAKDMLAFPKPAKVRARELLAYFSHGIREHKNATRDCAVCHLKDERVAVAISFGGESAYPPVTGTFKTTILSHAPCFQNCHWDKDDPKKDNCAGCHLTNTIWATKKPSQLLPAAADWFKDWPREWPRRLSLKFSHESKSHRLEENPELVCTECHITIRQSEPLEIPDVPISTCAKSGCHFERASRTSIRKEMLAEDEDIALGRDNDPASKGGENTCTGCHTKMIGSLPPPCSHYLLFEEKYFDVANYPKSAKQLSGRCKK